MSLAKEAGSVAATEWTPSLAAIDLDGTLLDAQGRLSPYNKAVLRRWVDSGRALALVSARSPGGIKPILGELDVECAVGAFNGSFVWMGVGAGEVDSSLLLLEQPVPSEIARGIWTTASELNVPILRYERGIATASKEDPLIAREISITGEAVRYQADVNSHLPVYKLMLMTAGCDRTAVWEKLPRSSAISMYSTRAGNIEVTSSRSGKDRALRVICAHLKIGLTHTVAIGDGENDLSMFAIAGRSVAAPGADSAAREAADMRLPGERSEQVGECLLRWLG